MGREYDIQLLDIVLAAAAANRMRHEPVWLMIVGGSGTGKTEVAKSLVGIGAHIVSTIHSEGALLSASKKEGKEGSGTGGLLKEVGPDAIVVLKDFTSILSMPERGQRPLILAALREIHDGNWIRKVGVDGGRSIPWKGHLGIIGCCTTAWDMAHTAIAAMGDRFTVVRINSRDMDYRLAAGAQAMANLGKEKEMAYELKEAVRYVLEKTGPHCKPVELPSAINDVILQACNIAASARTPTEHDHRGKTEFSHDPEAPTRLPRSLMQLMQGAITLGIPLDQAFNMAIRCIRDSISTIRLECLDYMSRNADCTVSDIAYGLQRPWNAVDKAIQALFSANMLTTERIGKGKDGKSVVCYNLRPKLDISVLWTKASLASTD